MLGLETSLDYEDAHRHAVGIPDLHQSQRSCDQSRTDSCQSDDAPPADI